MGAGGGGGGATGISGAGAGSWVGTGVSAAGGIGSFPKGSKVGAGGVGGGATGISGEEASGISGILFTGFDTPPSAVVLSLEKGSYFVFVSVGLEEGSIVEVTS